MKRLLILMLLLSLPLASALDFSNYPDQFFKGDDFDAIIVVGKAAPSQDVASAIQLVPTLQSQSEERLGNARLDEDIDKYMLESEHTISIGTACDNRVTYDIMGLDKCTEFEFEEGTGYLFLYKNELGRAWLVIAGGTPQDTYKAATVLGTYKEYDLEGNAIEVTGKNSPYTITQTNLPRPAEPEIETKSEPKVETEEPEQVEEPVERVSEREQELQAKIDRLARDEPVQTAEPEEEKPAPTGDTWYEKAWGRFKTWLLWFFER